MTQQFSKIYISKDFKTIEKDAEGYFEVEHEGQEYLIPIQTLNVSIKDGKPVINGMYVYSFSVKFEGKIYSIADILEVGKSYKGNVIIGDLKIPYKSHPVYNMEKKGDQN